MAAASATAQIYSFAFHGLLTEETVLKFCRRVVCWFLDNLTKFLQNSPPVGLGIGRSLGSLLGAPPTQRKVVLRL